MKFTGLIDNWYVDYSRSSGNYLRVVGTISGLNHINFPDGSHFDFFSKTEPPFFKSRILRSNVDNFYRLGDPAKENKLV